MDYSHKSRGYLRGEFSQTSAPPMAPKPKFDPGNPFGSLTAGKQQFTFLGDTNHGDPSIIAKVADNIPAMAKSGVKHIMLEFPPSPELNSLLDKMYQKPSGITNDEVIFSSQLFEPTHTAVIWTG